MIEKTQSVQSLQFDPLYWDDPYPIALALKHLYPTADPTEISLEALQHRVIALKEFADDKTVMPIERLEEIQVEWIELS